MPVGFLSLSHCGYVQLAVVSVYLGKITIFCQRVSVGDLNIVFAGLRMYLFLHSSLPPPTSKGI